MGQKPDEEQKISWSELRDFRFLPPVTYPDVLLEKSRIQILNQIARTSRYGTISWPRIGLMVLVAFYMMLGLSIALIIDPGFFLDFILAALNSESLPVGIPLACLYLFLLGVGLRLLGQSEENNPDTLI
jgi:uncharacterized membrane protein (DUF485 family)